MANFVRAAAEPRCGNPTIAQLRQTMPAYFSAADTRCRKLSVRFRLHTPRQFSVVSGPITTLGLLLFTSSRPSSTRSPLRLRRGRNNTITHGTYARCCGPFPRVKQANSTANCPSAIKNSRSTLQHRSYVFLKSRTGSLIQRQPKRTSNLLGLHC